MKKFLLKNSKLKFVFLFIFLVCDVIILAFFGMKVVSYMQINAKSAEYRQSIDSVASTSGNVKGRDVYNALSSLKTIKSISSISELDNSPSRNVIGTVDLESLKSISEDVVIEFVVSSNDPSSTLSELQSNGLSYDYISIDSSNAITCRVFVKGGV